MSKRKIPKFSGLFSKPEANDTGKIRKFTVEENVWLETLNRSQAYKSMNDKDVKEQLLKIGFPDHLINAFIACREKKVVNN